jgi:hypothetical protein
MSDEVDEQLEKQPVNGGLMFSADAYSLDDYAGEIEQRWWTPDKSQPTRKVRLDIRIQALKSADLRLINKKVSEQQRAAADVEFQQQQLSRCKPPRELDRLQKKLGEIRESDFTDDSDANVVEGYKTAEDKAEEARTKLETQIKTMQDQWKADYKKIGDEIDRLLALPSFYEILRNEFFVKVIDDHSIAWHGPKLDFSVATNDEPPSSFAGLLYTYLLEVISDQKKVGKRSNGSHG